MSLYNIFFEQFYCVAILFERLKTTALEEE